MKLPGTNRLLFAVAVLLAIMPSVSHAQRAFDRAGLVARAHGLRFGPSSAAICGDVGIRVESLNTVRTLTAAQLRRGRVVARAYSSAAFSSIGFAAGWNFIYIDSVAGGWRQMVVPENPAAPLRAVRLQFLDHAPHAFAAPVIRCLGASEGVVWYACGSRCCCYPPSGDCIPPQTLQMLTGSPRYGDYTRRSDPNTTNPIPGDPRNLPRDSQIRE